MTGGVRGGLEQRQLGAAGLVGHPTARREPAGGRRRGQVRRQARDRVEPVAGVGGALGQRLEQRLGVAVLGAGEQLPGLGRLDDLARVHDRHPVGAAGDHTQVVRHQDHRHVELVAQPVDQLQDLLLHGHVERRGRLVGDEQLRLADQRHGDHDALPLAAGELVRVVVVAAGRAGDADQAEHLHDPLPGLRLGHAAVQPQRLGDLRADGGDRIERGHRVLEDHADVDAADAPQGRLVQRHQVDPVEEDLPADDLPARRQQPLDGHRGHRLAAAGLADDAQRLTSVDGQRDVVEGVHDRAAEPDVRRDGSQFQQRHGVPSWGGDGSVRRRSAPLETHLDRVPEAVADEVHRDDDQDDRKTGRVDQPPFTGVDEVGAAVEHRAPVGGR